MATPLNTFAALFCAVTLMACSGSETADSVQSAVPVSYVVKSGPARTVANLEIEGMMCETACGGKIRKELEKVNGVSLATVSFADEQITNQAVVEFDPAVTNEQALIQAVNQIADGKLYKVKSVEVTRFENNAESSSRKEQNQDKKFEVSTVFEFPNVVRILEKLLR